MRCSTKWCLVLAIALLASLVACKSPEQIQAEQDQADDARCAGMGVILAPGDPQYVQCRMWAAQMRDQEEQARRQALISAFAVYGEMRQRLPAQPYGQPYGYDEYEALPQPQWIVPPPAPQNTWCRPVGRWMSCTTQ